MNPDRFFLALLLAGCSTADSSSTSPASAATERSVTRLTAPEVLAIAKALAAELGVPDKKRASLLERLEKVLTKPKHFPGAYRTIDSLGVTAVVAYRIGEAGAVVTAKGGRMLVRMEGTTHAFKVRGWDLGVRVDATREWGVGVLVGLDDPGRIAGIYEGLRESVAVVAGAGRAELKARGQRHELVLLGRSAGATFGAGNSKLTLVAE